MKQQKFIAWSCRLLQGKQGKDALSRLKGTWAKDWNNMHVLSNREHCSSAVHQVVGGLISYQCLWSNMDFPVLPEFFVQLSLAAFRPRVLILRMANWLGE